MCYFGTVGMRLDIVSSSEVAETRWTPETFETIDTRNLQNSSDHLGDSFQVVFNQGMQMVSLD